LEPERAFGLVLRELRLGRGFSQERLAFDTGLQRNYVSLLERGINSASLRTLFKLAPVLGVSVSELLVQTEMRLRANSQRKRR
jgi:transcriptional regulator with XRE-family HTH domain